MDVLVSLKLHIIIGMHMTRRQYNDTKETAPARELFLSDKAFQAS